MTTVLPQHLQALAHAQEKRLGLATFKRECHELTTYDAAQKVTDAIERDYDDFIIGSARIGYLLLGIRRLGTGRVDRCLHVAGVLSADRRIRDLTPRQRKAVVAQVRLWAEGWQHD